MLKKYFNLSTFILVFITVIFYSCSETSLNDNGKTKSSAQFSATMTPFHILPMKIQFKSTSGKDSYSYHWNFGDGATSNTQNPVHGYNGKGTYKVTLQVTTANGKRYSSSKKMIINIPKPQNYEHFIYLIPKGVTYHENWKKLFRHFAIKMQTWIKQHSGSSHKTFQFNPDSSIIDVVKSDKTVSFFRPPKSLSDTTSGWDTYSLRKIRNYVYDHPQKFHLRDPKHRFIKLWADIHAKPLSAPHHQNGYSYEAGPLLQKGPNLAITYCPALKPDENPANFPSGRWVGCVAHEMGHSLGLPHSSANGKNYLPNTLMGQCSNFPNIHMSKYTQQRIADSTRAFFDYSNYPYLKVE